MFWTGARGRATALPAVSFVRCGDSRACQFLVPRTQLTVMWWHKALGSHLLQRTPNCWEPAVAEQTASSCSLPTTSRYSVAWPHLLRFSTSAPRQEAISICADAASAARTSRATATCDRQDTRVRVGLFVLAGKVELCQRHAGTYVASDALYRKLAACGGRVPANRCMCKQLVKQSSRNSCCAYPQNC